MLNKEAYYDAIVDTIVEIRSAEDFIVTLARLIQRLVMDHLHIIGDIYDRGPSPHFIMDKLCAYHSLDIQWGNHDVIWMGAAAGNTACIANVLRTSIRYGNMDLQEDGYGINLLPLATFAMETYEEDPCECFQIKEGRNVEFEEEEKRLITMMHKAILCATKTRGTADPPQTGIRNERQGDPGQDRLREGERDIGRKSLSPAGYEFPDRRSRGSVRTVRCRGGCHGAPAGFVPALRETPDPLKFLLKKGNLYKVYNGNLLYHGCMPLDENGEFKKVNVYGTEYAGKKLYDELESYVRKAFFAIDEEEKEKGSDILVSLVRPGFATLRKEQDGDLRALFPERWRDSKRRSGIRTTHIWTSRTSRTGS